MLLEMCLWHGKSALFPLGGRVVFTEIKDRLRVGIGRDCKAIAHQGSCHANSNGLHLVTMNASGLIKLVRLLP